MQFTLVKIFSIAAAALVVGAIPAHTAEVNKAIASSIEHVIDARSTASQLAPQDFQVGSVWTEANKGGTGGGLYVDGIPSSCRSFFPAFTNTISSIQINSGFRCIFSIGGNCIGPRIIVQNGGYAPNLGGTNFDNSITSYQCISSS
ncbi:hypothetical protein QCA50_008604 [Cerrena zonata]|uniref:Uncharacterized protein n=1 Tax=Cerrena zonata TaxID=2478898 RepID=A0AAW0GA47_9APHY